MPVALHDELLKASDLLRSIASGLEEDYGADDARMEAAVSGVVSCAANLLHTVGEHDFNLDDHPPGII